MYVQAVEAKKKFEEIRCTVENHKRFYRNFSEIFIKFFHKKLILFNSQRSHLLGHNTVSVRLAIPLSPFPVCSEFITFVNTCLPVFSFTRWLIFNFIVLFFLHLDDYHFTCISWSTRILCTPYLPLKWYLTCWSTGDK